MKTCTACGNDFPATADFFYEKPDGTLRPRCKGCHGKAGTKLRRENRAKGLCFCGASPKKGRRLCEAHLQAHNNRYYTINRNDPEWMRKNNERSKRQLRTLKAEAFAAYGNACACRGCGETRVEFLSIDHIVPVFASKTRATRLGSRNGMRRPPPERSGNRSGQGLYRWLKKNSYPAGFRVLCMNCNFSLGHFGYCPHERESVLTA